MRVDRVLQIMLAAALVSLGYIVVTTIPQPLIEAGHAAPQFTVRTETGKTITPASFGGKVLVLNFWATWCPPCIRELPSLNELAQRLGPDGVVVLGVSVDRSEPAYRQFLQRFGVAFETSRDPEGAISSSYGTFKFPETYVIDSSGKVRLKYINEQNWLSDDIIGAIRSLL